MAYTPPPGLYGSYGAVAPPSSLNAYQKLQQGAMTGYLEPSQIAGVAGVPGQPLPVGATVGVAGVQAVGANLLQPGTTGYVAGSLVSFDAEKDCRALNKAIKGAGTDEKALIKILCHRPREHIDKIVHLYTRRYKAALYRDIKHDTTFNFKKTLLKIVQPIEEVKAKRLYKAMKGLGTKDRSLIDVLAFSTNDEIRRIKWEYQNYYGKDGDIGDALSRDIKDDTSGNFERGLITLLKAERDESYLINEDKVKADAKHLFEKGAGRLGTDDSYFIEFFCTRSPWHIAAVGEEYKKQHGKDLIAVIKGETSGDYQDLLRALVTPKASWYAERLEYSVKGVGTHDKLLIYLLTSTTEVERMAIRKKYEEMYKMPLKKRIAEDTSGDYMKTLLSLLTFDGEDESHLDSKSAPAKKN
jgi:hypothetical protein